MSVSDTGGTMRRLLTGLIATSALVSCAQAPPAASPGSEVPSHTPTPSASDQGADGSPDIYAAMIREVAGAEGPSWERIFVVTRICDNAADPAEPSGCADAFSEDDQAALTQALPKLADRLRFIDDPSRLYSDGWFGGTGPTTVVIRVGPIVRTDDGVEIGASYGCGGLCGSGTTYRLEASPDGWTVTGTTGVSWIA
jgi:hypothetical protein